MSFIPRQDSTLWRGYRTSRATASTTSVFHATDVHRYVSTTTGFEPYGSPDFKERRRMLAEELKHSWVESHALPDLQDALIDSFFPNPSESEGLFQYLKNKGHYGAVFRSPARGPNGRRDKPSTMEGWTKWPSPTGGRAGEPETAITKTFIHILNEIIDQLGLADSRVAVDRQATPIQAQDKGDLKPDVFIWGMGSGVFPPVRGKPSSTMPSKAKKHMTCGGSSEEPQVGWPWCVCPIEVKTEKQRGATTNHNTFAQLGTYVREVLVAQEHRRFVPSLVLTESTVEFLLWDRAGVVVSRRFDHHKEALLFCHMLATIVKWNGVELGFDISLSFLDTEVHISTVDPSFKYVIDKTFSRSYTIRSRGSTCWLAHRLGDESAHYIILDSWVEGGSKREKEILSQIENVRSRQNIAGVASLVSIEDVKLEIPGSQPHPDTTRHNRRSPLLAGGLDLVHTRTVLGCASDCRPLESFKSSYELVAALHDVIKGLGTYNKNASIVHRDITPWNIFIQPDAMEGSRGILVDFSCSMFEDSDKPPPQPNMTPGAHVFRCSNSLMGETSYSHLDELESFYWMLCFFVVGHAGPDLAASRITPLPADLVLWSQRRDAVAATAKRTHFHAVFDLSVQPWFGSPVERLVASLHSFFHTQHSRRHKAHEAGRYVTSDACEDYRDFLALFAIALRELEPPIVLLNLEEVSIEPSQKDTVIQTQDVPLHHKRSVHVMIENGSGISESAPRSKKMRLNRPETVVGEQAVEIVDLFQVSLSQDLICGVSVCV